MDVIRAQRLPTGVDDEWVVVGKGRWMLWHHPDASSAAFLRFGLAADERWEIQEVRFVPRLRDRPVRANDLRLLALGRIEAMAGDPEVKLMLDSPDHAALPDLNADGRVAAPLIERCSQMPERARPSSLKITVPPKGQRDTWFYFALEMAYSRAAAESRHPAKALAEANGVPVTTVHAWLKAMRRFSAQVAAENAASDQRKAEKAAAFEAGLDQMGLTFDDYYVLHQDDDPLGYWASDGEGSHG